jgi:hypothetical protein
VIKSFIHIVLIVSVFFSSAGFWVSNHFCQNRLVKTSLFVNFESCCSNNATSCSSDKKCFDLEEKDGCCHNTPSFHKLDQNQFIVDTDFNSFEELISFDIILLPINISIPIIDEEYLKYYTYDSPPIVFDRKVRFQTFLC